VHPLKDALVRYALIWRKFVIIILMKEAEK